MTPAPVHEFTDQDHDQSESNAPRMQRMHRNTKPLHGKYVKKRPAVCRGMKHRRIRRVMW